MIILAIETSCDETGIAILSVKKQSFKVLANFVVSQIDIHKKYGGVVPEVAARKHLENILPLLDQALKKSKIKLKNIDIIAAVKGPGLITSLIVGLETAKTLSLALNKPLIGINHIHAHLIANWFSGHQGQLKNIKLPAMGLVVSGGHTLLVLIKKIGRYQIIGQTRDDAVGEAFDKVAKILKVGYPGGPILSQIAENQAVNYFKLPRPMINSGDFDFSFSGLKTAVGDAWAKVKVQDQSNKKRMAAAFQQACIDVLIAKTLIAAKNFKVKSILMGGGVSANKPLRTQLAQAVKVQLPQVNFYLPDLNLTTDNALMVAAAGYFDFIAGKKDDFRKIKVDPNLSL